MPSSVKPNQLLQLIFFVICKKRESQRWRSLALFYGWPCCDPMSHYCLFPWLLHKFKVKAFWLELAVKWGIINIFYAFCTFFRLYVLTINLWMKLVIMSCEKYGQIAWRMSNWFFHSRHLPFNRAFSYPAFS